MEMSDILKQGQGAAPMSTQGKLIADQRNGYLTAEDVADISAAYDEDVAQIAQMQDVTFIAP